MGKDTVAPQEEVYGEKSLELRDDTSELKGHYELTLSVPRRDAAVTQVKQLIEVTLDGSVRIEIDLVEVQDGHRKAIIGVLLDPQEMTGKGNADGNRNYDPSPTTHVNLSSHRVPKISGARVIIEPTPDKNIYDVRVEQGKNGRSLTHE